jgi:hypothetical protein
MLPPLNATADFDIWPRLSPDEWLDFNPSIATLATGQKIALVRRDRIPPVPGEGTVWSVLLDDQLHPCGVPYPLVDRGEDPRAVVIGERLYLFYVVIEKNADGKILGSCEMLTEFVAATFPLVPIRSFQLPKNPVSDPQRANTTWEKNWVPFALNDGNIALIYTHQPWTILHLNVAPEVPIPEFLAVFSIGEIKWDYGEIRGGTPPIVFDENSLITFFHSAQVIGSRNVYMVGACVFRNSPPYEPRLITTEPLLVARYRTTAARFGWGVLASVIFPLGAIQQNSIFKLLCGIDDGEIGIFAMTTEELKSRLCPFIQRPNLSVLPNSGSAFRISEGPLVFTSQPQSSSVVLPLARFLRMLSNNNGIFLDIGAGEGLFTIYLADTVMDVIAIEASEQDLLKRNLALNSVHNCRVYSTIGEVRWEEFGDSANISVVRVNAPATQEAIKSAVHMIQKCLPIVLIHLPPSGEESTSCKGMLADLGYSVEHLFELQPQVVLCTTAIHRERYCWLLE